MKTKPRYTGHWGHGREWHILRARCIHCDYSVVGHVGRRTTEAVLARLRGLIYRHLDDCHADRLGPQEPAP